MCFWLIVGKEADEVTEYNSYNSQSNGFLIPAAGKGAASIARGGTSGLQLVRDALRSLRKSFSGHDPRHHTMDSLEQGVSSLMETQKKQERKVRGKSPRTQAGSEYRESGPPHSKWPHSQSSPAVSSNRPKGSISLTSHLRPSWSIYQRLREVTLKDSKAAVDQEGNHWYHFKALDPGIGTVKEEVFHDDDDDAIPGWEGKIVA
ncbi:Dixin [Fukomys damarensis]|uniref:Dixin n=1 Tax=Fukomys damarensis TaxID=885580 RepID=A0A091DUP7_FUKDA|nr:Dixin [Fukomys damarensis]